MAVPRNGWFGDNKNPIIKDDLGVPLFEETPKRWSKNMFQPFCMMVSHMFQAFCRDSSLQNKKKQSLSVEMLSQAAERSQAATPMQSDTS